MLGSGAREHALAWRLARDGEVRSVRIAPGNAGTRAVGESVNIDPADPVAVARHAVRERYDLVVIGPEGPLAAGVADALSTARIPSLGPSRGAARLESSKAFAKEQMRRAGVRTPEAAVFSDPDAALAHVRRAEAPAVVKADWLAAGKGVVVPETHDEAEGAVRALFEGVAPGARLLLEERVHGPEVSAFALVSDESVVPLAAACDYKRLADGDAGPNTGGMGAYTPVPWFGWADLERAAAEVFEPIAWRMARDGFPYRGVLYAGLVVTADGPTVLEFNARFGDPEAQVLMPVLEGELGTALLGCAIGDRSLMEGSIVAGAGAAVGVVVASEGYPEAPVVERRLEGAEPAGPQDDGPVLAFHGATHRGSHGGLVTSGGRAVTIVGRGPDLLSAREAAYRGVGGVELQNGRFRTDIAVRELGETGRHPDDGRELGDEAG